MVFLTRLAEHLGKSLAELDNLTLDEVRIWIAVDSVEPLGMRRLEYYFAMLASMLYSRWSKPGAAPKNLSDFILFDALRVRRNVLDEDLVKAFTSMQHTTQQANED